MHTSCLIADEMVIFPALELMTRISISAFVPFPSSCLWGVDPRSSCGRGYLQLFLLGCFAWFWGNPSNLEWKRSSFPGRLITG